MVRQEADGKRFLNLFAYTGAFTVYAAAGGAISTTSVDLSSNYLRWAEDNLKANKLNGPRHSFVRADSFEFLRNAKLENNQFDLCVVDPPTYSNSKQTENDWDIQTHYVEMLDLIAKIMSPKGVVYFSTNFRRFKFDENSLSGFPGMSGNQQANSPGRFSKSADSPVLEAGLSGIRLKHGQPIALFSEIHPRPPGS